MSLHEVKDEKTRDNCSAYLRSQFLVYCTVGIGTIKRLLQKSEQDRDDDDRLQRLSKDDEEDGD